LTKSAPEPSVASIFSGAGEVGASTSVANLLDAGLLRLDDLGRVQVYIHLSGSGLRTSVFRISPVARSLEPEAQADIGSDQERHHRVAFADEDLVGHARPQIISKGVSGLQH